MARSEIYAGICGFKTEVETRMEGSKCLIQIKSDCVEIQRMAEELNEVNPFGEISFRGDGPLNLKLGAKHCAHERRIDLLHVSHHAGLSVSRLQPRWRPQLVKAGSCDLHAQRQKI